MQAVTRLCVATTVDWVSHASGREKRLKNGLLSKLGSAPAIRFAKNPLANYSHINMHLLLREPARPTSPHLRWVLRWGYGHENLVRAGDCSVFLMNFQKLIDE